MKMLKWLAVGTALVMLLGAATVAACDSGDCDGKCGDDCKCKGKCDGKCGDDCKCKGKCDGKCGDDCKGKAKGKDDSGEFSDIRYSDSIFLGFETKRLANGLPIVTQVEPEGVGSAFGLRAGDIILSSNGREIGQFNRFLKALDSTPKAPLAIRVLRLGQIRNLSKGKCGGGCGDCKGKGKCGDDCGDDCKGKKGKCGGDCGDDCKGKKGKCGGDCKGKGKCGGGCGDDGKCGCGEKKKVVEAPKRLGIGVILGFIPALCDDGTLMVKDLQAGKTASTTGLMKGDVILAVNGVDVTAKNRLGAFIVSPGNSPSFLVLRGKLPLRLCAGKCGKDCCDGCKGRCKDGCGSGSSGGCGGHGGGCGGCK